ncbi:MAG: hypothetical protein KAT43_03645 [Nanoarchaeota archaeon]|nr:hypothetical protein [Nanoarchaeota archaeon]
MIADKEITEIVKSLREIDCLKAVILSNDEFLVVLDMKAYEQFYPRIKKILKGHKFTLHNIDEAHELKDALRSGQFVYGALNFSQLKLKPYVLVSYDLTKLKSAKKVKISKAIYGHSLTIKGKKYSYKGLKDQEGFELISKSTMLITAEKFPMFRHFLDDNKVEYMSKEVWV